MFLNKADTGIDDVAVSIWDAGVARLQIVVVSLYVGGHLLQDSLCFRSSYLSCSEHHLQFIALSYHYVPLWRDGRLGRRSARASPAL